MLPDYLFQKLPKFILLEIPYKGLNLLNVTLTYDHFYLLRSLKCVSGEQMDGLSLGLGRGQVTPEDLSEAQTMLPRALEQHVSDLAKNSLRSCSGIPQVSKKKLKIPIPTTRKLTSTKTSCK